jgi:hypothetical protein
MESDMGLYPELNNLNLEQLVEAFKNQHLEGAEPTFAYFSEVALLIEQQGEAGITFLWQEIDFADTERLRAIIFALADSKSESHLLRDRLLSYLKDERPLIIAEAIEGLRHQGETGADVVDRMLALSQHESPYVRNSVIRYFASLPPDKALSLIRPFLNDADAGVRETAVDELGYLGETDALPYIRPLLNDPDLHVREAAQTTIQLLSQ